MSLGDIGPRFGIIEYLIHIVEKFLPPRGPQPGASHLRFQLGEQIWSEQIWRQVEINGRGHLLKYPNVEQRLVSGAEPNQFSLSSLTP